VPKTLGSPLPPALVYWVYYSSAVFFLHALGHKAEPPKLCARENHASRARPLLLAVTTWLAATSATDSSKQGTKSTDAYDAYVAAQRSKTDKLAADGQAVDQWVCREQIEAVAKHFSSHVTIKTRFAFCHGTRSGREAVWFRELLPDVQTWGTELSPIAARSSPWTIPWDFHDVRPEWLGKLDFVYCNALDHSFNATLAISQWMSELHSDGALWSKGYNKASNSIDLFRGGSATLLSTICKAGPFTVINLPLPPWKPSAEIENRLKVSGRGWRSQRGDHAYVVRHSGRTQDSARPSPKDLCHG